MKSITFNALWSVPIALQMTACGPTIDLSDGGEAMSTSDGDSTNPSPPTTSGTPPDPPPPPPSTSTSTSTTSPTADGDTIMVDEEGGGSFIIELDYGGPGDPCDIWAQDCGPDEKCMPWAYDGGDTVNWWRCSPIVDDPAAVGEPCIVDAYPTSGIDTCDAESMCWDVNPETLEGYCVQLCGGTPGSPSCDNPDEQCLNPEDALLVVCLPACDPLLQDCILAGNGCYPTGDQYGFVCVPEERDAVGPGSPCDTIASCEEGSTCVHYEHVPGCETRDACCVSYCDPSEPDADAPCLPGQECIPFWEEGVGWDISPGFCGLPLI